MANYYRNVTAFEVLRASKRDFEALAKVWEPEGYDEDGFEKEASGLVVIYDKDEKGLYIYSEESGDIERVPAEALKKLGEIIEKAGKPFLEFGWADYCDRPRPGSSGGGEFRVYPDGSVKYPSVVWE